MASKTISLSGIALGIGLFILVTIPLIILLMNNQQIEVSVKSADQSVKELTLQNEDLIRGRVADRDSVELFKQHTQKVMNSKDSTIIQLEKKAKKMENERTELKQEMDSIKKVLKSIKWSDLQPISDQKH